ncbi:unnamed protein product [Rhizoctonia solani]|uniref:Ricin B lectin domain-containing protein n=1 Tax=Rhizoctonia solani TaxID=456999 RepID=A0A8H3DU46_9AGAM|nr:unnamed protein product [Rhizoctonia solani]
MHPLLQTHTTFTALHTDNMSSNSNQITEGTYTIKNVSTGTVMDLYDGLAAEGTQIQGFKGHGGDNQKWHLKYTGNGHSLTLQNVKSGTYLSFSAIKNSTRVVGSRTARNIVLVSSKNGYVMETAEKREYVLDLKESNPANETPVIIYNDNNTDNQKWHFIPA